MTWILATRGVLIRQRVAPYTETAVEEAHSVVYQPGIEPVTLYEDGMDGTYARGLARVKGYIFATSANTAENLLGISEEVDIVVLYQGDGPPRRRTLVRAVFVGDSTVAVPSMAAGPPALVGVPFRLQIPAWDELNEHIIDSEDSQP